MELLPPLICLILLTIGGLFLVGLGLPGAFLVAIGIWALGAWPGVSMGFDPWAWQILASLLAVAAAGELLEMLTMYLGGRKLNLSRPAMLSAMAGGLVGAFMGSVAGPFAALFASWLGLVVFTIFWLVAFENEAFWDGLKGGLRALFARLIGLGIKASMMLGMVIWAGFQWFRHHSGGVL